MPKSRRKRIRIKTRKTRKATKSRKRYTKKGGVRNRLESPSSPNSARNSPRTPSPKKSHREVVEVAIVMGDPRLKRTPSGRLPRLTRDQLQQIVKDAIEKSQYP